MKKIYCLFAYGILFTSVSYSQKLRYGGIQQLGIVVTEHETRTNFTLVNGLRFGRFFTGIGAHTQFNRRFYNAFYYCNSIFNTTAVYVDGRYYIDKKKNFFTKVNGGVNLITQKLETHYYYNFKKRPGYYCSAGLGFKARIGKEIFYSFDITYCLRQIKYAYKNMNYVTRQFETEKFDLRQSAIIITMGIEIF